MTANDIDEFRRDYVICALWSSTGDDGEPLDNGRDSDDVSAATMATMREECAAFWAMNAADLEHLDAGQCGHDFWLTRNGHGTGFWDRGYPNGIGDRLTAASKMFGTVDLYVGDDGLVHQA